MGYETHIWSTEARQDTDAITEGLAIKIADRLYGQFATKGGSLCLADIVTENPNTNYAIDFLIESGVTHLDAEEQDRAFTVMGALQLR